MAIPASCLAKDREANAVRACVRVGTLLASMLARSPCRHNLLNRGRTRAMASDASTTMYLCCIVVLDYPG